MMLVANQTRKGGLYDEIYCRRKAGIFQDSGAEVFAYVCELGRMITQIILENYDDELAKERDKKAYRDKVEKGNFNQNRVWGS